MPIPSLASARLPERLGSYAASSQVVGALRTAAAATGVSFEMLASKAAMESGLRADAQAPTSSARGLFQFIDQTWLGMVQQHGAAHGLGTEAAAVVSGPGGRLTVQDPAERSRILALRDDPETSARFAGEYLRGLSDSLTPVLGRRPDAAELYLGHFLGAGGATKMLQAVAADPGRTAASVLPAAAAANPRMFNGSDGQPLSVAQFAERVRGRLNRSYSELGLVPPGGPMDFQPTAEAAVTRAVAGERGTWGNGTPARITHGAERAMLATLSKVFTRMSRGPGHAGQDDPPEAIPAAVLGALRADAPAAGTAPGTRSS